MKLLAFAIASLPILAKAMALGLAEDGPGGGQHLEARREPIYPTKVTVRARAPIYPTKVTVRARGDLEPSEVTPVEQDLEKRRPPKITLKTVKAKRSDDGDDCPIRRAATPTTVTTATDEGKPYETVICKPCPPGKVCPAVCIPITTTITPRPKPSTTVICELCPKGKICPMICKLTTVTVKPEPTPITDCCPPGAQCFAPCSLPTPEETRRA